MERFGWFLAVFAFVLFVNVGSMLVPGYRTGTKLYQVAVRFGIIAVLLLVGLAYLRR